MRLQHHLRTKKLNESSFAVYVTVVSRLQWVGWGQFPAGFRWSQSSGLADLTPRFFMAASAARPHRLLCPGESVRQQIEAFRDSSEKLLIILLSSSWLFTAGPLQGAENQSALQRPAHYLPIEGHFGCGGIQ